ncbi:hypothetical protein FSOLCH5_008173 [Fusarium solani]|uniref:T6SS Phospholipase effector Tle1-like catalytic domain-containing protein n=1 Tax=Fusarium solani TaxID=169388 RepID=A0A9P9KTR9_FUSSL|nr:uncharacterized protein B0J15DRAFT_545247 [Fusarium solani]KAH7268382.1 hypothetical protein B0J15DRAFT_545247 [Fusarium solani]KAJ3460479.1 hypothetical protein MRS44_011346 [Fusarium solani]KAJ4211842.1 hypothetical protein NW759_012131 [Fusarium solani]
MTHAESPSAAADNGEEHKKLILCFDGTGNTFSGTNADTNVVKILRKLDRNHPNQFHYYQTGIGTYDVNESSVNKTYLGEMRSSFSKTIDQGFGTTFDAHVIAGYRFLMRYYETDARIYIFGFSRGAFTAKFLARMVNKVGLLCKGNEEMVPFAYRLYQRALKCESDDRVAAQKEKQTATGQKTKVYTNGSHCKDQVEHLLGGDAVVKESKATQAATKEIEAFSQTFCRNAGDVSKHKNIKVFFLGMWDCVNSVAVVEKSAPAPVGVAGTAEHVRHAVAVDERRVKFKPALLAQDIRHNHHEHDKFEDVKLDDIHEVWFPGNHGDIGGGWPALDLPKIEDMGFWQRIKHYWTTLKAKNQDEPLDDSRLQMSDMALEWMIREVDIVGQKDPKSKVHWCPTGLATFKQLMNDEEKVKELVIKGFMHDCLSFGRGTALFKVMMWKFMEILPFIPRWELNDLAEKEEDKGWEPYRGWPNKGAYRDIPRRAILHDSLKRRLEDVKSYYPKNNHGAKEPCLRPNHKGDIAVMDEVPLNFVVDYKGAVTEAARTKREEEVKKEEPWHVRHQTWQLNPPGTIQLC